MARRVIALESGNVLARRCPSAGNFVSQNFEAIGKIGAIDRKRHPRFQQSLPDMKLRVRRKRVFAQKARPGPQFIPVLTVKNEININSRVRHNTNSAGFSAESAFRRFIIYYPGQRAAVYAQIAMTIYALFYEAAFSKVRNLDGLMFILPIYVKHAQDKERRKNKA